MARRLVFIILLLLFFTSRCMYIRYSGGEPEVKVLLKEANSISFSSTGETYFIMDNKKYIIKERKWTVSKDAVILNNNSQIEKISFPFIVRPKNGYLKYKVRRYRGEFIIDYYNGRILLINRLPLEEYLYGVVGPEIGGVKKEVFEAAKAQSVAARSYSLSAIKRKKSRPFDLYGDTRDQVYVGLDAENELIIKAVNKTRGYTLTYKGEPIVAYYHSTCGGITASSEDVWSKKITYIKSVKDTPHHRGKNYFCKPSPHFKWEIKFQKDRFLSKIVQAINKSDARRVKIKLSINRKTRRINKVIVETDRGDGSISGSRFRNLFGLKSTWFTIKKKGNYYIIEGKGYGHGTGMCQWGAREMAKKGYNFKKILRHYYPKTHLRRFYH